MGNINKKVLNNIYHTSKTGLDSVEYLYGKVNNNKIKEELNNYVSRYYDILNKTRVQFEKIGEDTKDYTPVNRSLMWKGISSVINEDNSPSKVAEILIQGSSKGIVDMTKDINNETVDEDIRKIANTLIHYEKDNINDIKKYL